MFLLYVARGTFVSKPLNEIMQILPSRSSDSGIIFPSLRSLDSLGGKIIALSLDLEGSNSSLFHFRGFGQYIHPGMQFWKIIFWKTLVLHCPSQISKARPDPDPGLSPGRTLRDGCYIHFPLKIGLLTTFKKQNFQNYEGVTFKYFFFFCFEV